MSFINQVDFSKKIQKFIVLYRGFKAKWYNSRPITTVVKSLCLVGLNSRFPKINKKYCSHLFKEKCLKQDNVDIFRDISRPF